MEHKGSLLKLSLHGCDHKWVWVRIRASTATYGHNQFQLYVSASSHSKPQNLKLTILQVNLLNAIIWTELIFSP